MFCPYPADESADVPPVAVKVADSPKHMFNAGLDWDVTSKLLLWSQVNYNGKQ